MTWKEEHHEKDTSTIAEPANRQLPAVLPDRGQEPKYSRLVLVKLTAVKPVFEGTGLGTPSG